MKQTDVKNLQGEYGGLFINSASPYTATAGTSLSGLVCLQDTVIASITMESFGGTESKVQTLTLSAGTPIFGSITALTITSGLVQGFYSKA